MNNIFYGMLFVFLDFNIDFGSSRIGLIPDFIGYILIAYGLKELTSGKDKFSRVRPVAIGMAVYSGFIYGMDFMGAHVSLLPEVSVILGLVSVLVSLYISYSIVMGIKDLEASLEQDIGAQSLYTVWTISAILSVAVSVLLFFPALALLCTIGSIIAGIVFLVCLNRTRRLYYEGV